MLLKTTHRRENRSRRRRDRGGGRAPARHAPLSKHGQCAFRRARSTRLALRQAPHLWRRRHFACPCARRSTASATPRSCSPSMPGATSIRLFAGDTLYAASEVLDVADLGAAGALRLRLVAAKNKPCADFPYKNEAGEYDAAIVLDFDYWAAIPKRRWFRRRGSLRIVSAAPDIVAATTSAMIGHPETFLLLDPHRAFDRSAQIKCPVDCAACAPRARPDRAFRS